MTKTAFETFKSVSKIRRLDTSLVFYNSKGKKFDLHTVAALAVHRDIKTTQRYAHLSPEKLRKDIAVLDIPMTQNPHNGKIRGSSNR